MECYCTGNRVCKALYDTIRASEANASCQKKRRYLSCLRECVDGLLAIKNAYASFNKGCLAAADILPVPLWMLPTDSERVQWPNLEVPPIGKGNDACYRISEIGSL